MSALNAQQEQGQGPTAQPGEDRQIGPQDEKLAADFLKRIQAAQDKRDTKEAAQRFERNRTLVRGFDPDDNDGDKRKRLRANLFFANLAMMRPQVYAKDPEFSAKPTRAVPEQMLPAVRLLTQTAERVLDAELVKRCELKRRMKRAIGSCYTTSVAWLKMVWQEDKRTDPLVLNQINDTQDELMRLKALRAELDDPAVGQEHDLKIAQLQRAIEGLRVQSEVVVSRGLVLDHVWSEDVVILDDGIREVTDYKRARALAHRVWMTRQGYRERFGFDPKKAKVYSEVGSGAKAANQQPGSEGGLLAVWEVWDHDTSTIYHVCDGEKGFCDAPTQPDWTGERWFPFFLLAWNEIDGSFYPVSDVELTEPLVREYNETRDDFVKDRRDARPFTVVRKGGSLTDEDVKRVRNRDGNDIILVEGVGGQPIANDLQAVQLGRIDPQVYATQPSRADMEMIIGGGDAARGSVLEAKTATEAEILSQGLRGRSAERQDITEDLLNELGTCALQMCLRKLTPDEVRAIAGPDASWPVATKPEDVFRQITLEVRGGSTGKPDRLQDQDRWTKLLPVIEKTMQQVGELRAKGQDELAGALIELLRETLRRFEERLDIDQFMPKPETGKTDPAQMQAMLEASKQKIADLQDEVDKAHEDEEKTRLQVAAQIATSANPAAALIAFQEAIRIVDPEAGEAPEPGEPMGGEVGDAPGGIPAGAPQPQIPGLIAALAQQQGPAQGQDPQQLPA